MARKVVLTLIPVYPWLYFRALRKTRDSKNSLFDESLETGLSWLELVKFAENPLRLAT